MARRGIPVAFIDWDNAGPVDATWELAQAAWLNVQLHDAYGLARRHRRHFVHQIAELAVHSARQEAVDAAVAPGTTGAVAEDGFPLLWAITWRARSASWILKNVELLDSAVNR